MNSNLTHKSSNPATARDRFLQWLPMLLIVVAALIYYGSYLRYWFNPHDEGGTACLIAQRLMNGERPWVDVEPGYNIGWFTPIVALFKITGVNYLAARAYFFTLATITALLGFSVATRISGSRWIGLGVGLLLVALPGSQFKNYIPLAQAANTACLIWLVFIDPGLWKKWFGAVLLGGAVLGLTFLVRVEIGLFFATIWFLLLLLFLIDRRLPMLRRLGAVLAGIVVFATGCAVVQLPTYLSLRDRGLSGELVSEYSSWFSFLRFSLREQIEQKPALPAVTTVPPEQTGGTSEREAEEQAPSMAPATTLHDGEPAERTILRRKSLSVLWHGPADDWMLAFLTYAPFVGFTFFFVAGLSTFIPRAVRGDFALNARPLVWLLLVGASLTTYPQFFFFRPDRPHLSEFMPGHIIAMACCLWLLWPRGERKSPAIRVSAWALAVFLTCHLGIFAAFALDHPSSGTIAARFGRTTWFRGENGVQVREFKRQAKSFQMVHDAVMKVTGPKDYVICFPYMPGYNVMTNRPTYLRNVYVDNATHDEHWAEVTIRDLSEKKPAVVVIDDRAINGTDASRFSNWAKSVQAYLDANYTVIGHLETVKVYALPSKVPTAPAP